MLIPVNIFFNTELIESPAVLKHCVRAVMKAGTARGKTKGQKTASSFAICTAALQKAGIFKKGTKELTKKGAKISAEHGKEKKAGAKLAGYEKILAQAKKSRKK